MTTEEDRRYKVIMVKMSLIELRNKKEDLERRLVLIDSRIQAKRKLLEKLQSV